jgi:hypothetical protein
MHLLNQRFEVLIFLSSKPNLIEDYSKKVSLERFFEAEVGLNMTFIRTGTCLWLFTNGDSLLIVSCNTHSFIKVRGRIMYRQPPKKLA